MNLKESRRWWNCGREWPGEWAFEGKPKDKRVGFDGSTPLSVSANEWFAMRSFYKLEIGWHRDF